MSSAPASPGPDPESRNELRADSYVWFRSTDRRTARSILAVLEDFGIAAYFAVPDNSEDHPIDPEIAQADIVHVFVDSTETEQIRLIDDELNEAELTPRERSADRPAAAADRGELDATEVDARFAELIAQFNEPAHRPEGPELTELIEPVIPAARDELPASTKPPRSDDPPADTAFRPATSDFLADSEEDEHYVPPPPEPMKPLSSRSFTALTVLAIGCVLLFFPGLLGFSGTPIAVTGVVLITSGVGLLLLQLRDGPDDPGDDGARL